jgi:hypothetical protein
MWLAIRSITLLIFVITTCAAIEGAAIHGVWREPSNQIDIEMYPCPEAPALLCGRIVGLSKHGATNDRHNPQPELRERQLLGLEILHDFAPVAADRWEGGGDYGKRPGRIYLPANGDTLGDHRHRYQIRLDGDRLVISIVDCGILNCFGKSVWERLRAQ